MRCKLSVIPEMINLKTTELAGRKGVSGQCSDLRGGSLSCLNLLFFLFAVLATVPVFDILTKEGSVGSHTLIFTANVN
jgi:hypothetical protein